MSKSYKWLLIALLSCAFFFHQADRALFGLLTIPIQKDIGLTGMRGGADPIGGVRVVELIDSAVKGEE